MSQNERQSPTQQWADAIRTQVKNYQDQLVAASDELTYHSADGLFSLKFTSALEIDYCQLRGDFLGGGGTTALEHSIVATFNEAYDDAQLKILQSFQ